MLAVQTQAALTWIRMAFAKCGDHDPQEEITTLNDDMLRIFVNFYWSLHRGDDEAAEVLLQHERKKRGYGSFAYTVSGSTHSTKVKKELESFSVPPEVRNKHDPSQRVSIATKRKLLYDGVERHDNGLSAAAASAADHPVASGLPQTKNTFVGRPKISRRSKRGRSGDARTTPLPDQLHGRSAVQTSTDSTLNENRATIGVEKYHHHMFLKPLESFDHRENLKPNVFQPLPSQLHSLSPLKTSSYQTSETVYLIPGEKVFNPASPVTNGQYPSSGQLLYGDERGQDGVLVFGSTGFHPQVDDAMPMKIEAPITPVYRCKPPLDNFPPIWARVIQ